MANFLFLEQDLLSQHHKARGTHMLLNACSASENECRIVRKNIWFLLLSSEISARWNPVLVPRQCLRQVEKCPSFETFKNSTLKPHIPFHWGCRTALWGEGDFLPEQGLGIQVSPAWITETFLEINVFFKRFSPTSLICTPGLTLTGWKALSISQAALVWLCYYYQQNPHKFPPSDI